MFDSTSIEAIIEQALRRKFSNYNPEPSHMPFHTHLLGKDRMALYSFIHSLTTNFGTAIFEQVAGEIADGVFEQVSLQYTIPGILSKNAQGVIQDIINELSSGESEPNHNKEIARISKHATSRPVAKKKLRKVDIYLRRENQIYLIDLKTAKPNMSGFEKHKQDLLEWAAAILHQDLDMDVRIAIAIPYNPYEPEPYRRWTMRGMLEIENNSQLMVAHEFWNFLAGYDIYQDLLDCFKNVGLRMREEIDSYFKHLGENKYR